MMMKVDNNNAARLFSCLTLRRPKLIAEQRLLFKSGRGEKKDATTQGTTQHSKYRAKLPEHNTSV